MRGRLRVGVGAREALAQPGRGEVLAVYRQAAYLRIPGGIIAVVSPDVPSGPLWIRGDLPIDGARAGDPVLAGEGWLRLSGRDLPLAGAELWWGALPDPDGLRASAPLAREVLAASPPSPLLEAPWRPALDRATEALEQGDLVGVAAVLGGLGPGLTPAGDDALAGILLVHRVLAGPDAAPRLRAVAASAVTTELSAALLDWAARGQAVEPVHDLLTALATGRRQAAAAATRTVAGLGASSGTDVLLGIGLALSCGTPPGPAPS